MPVSRVSIPAAPIAALILAGCAGASNPAVDLAAEEAALIEASDAIVAAEMARDAESALAHYAPDAIVHPAGMPAVRGADAMRELYAEFFAMPMEFTATREGLHLAADASMAWESGANHFAMEDGSSLTGKYLAVWQKVDGVWKVRALAVSEDSPMPAPAAATTSQ